MKVLLIKPQQIRWENEEKRFAQPLGLLYLAGSLRKNGYDVHLIDAVAEDYDNEVKIKEGLYQYGPSNENLEKRITEISPNIIGIESNHTYFWEQVKDLVELIKRINRNIITVIGGHHVTGIKQEILQQSKDIDYIIEKEGEIKFLELVDSISGKSYTRKTQSLDNLNDLSAPAFDLLKPELYKAEVSPYIKPKSNNFFLYTSQRGCSHNCEFCSTPEFFGKITRHLPISKVRKHMEKIKEMGFKEIDFQDDNLLLMPENYRGEYLRIPKELDLYAFHDGGFYYPHVKQSHIKQLVEANVYGIFLPVESPDINIMHKQRKYLEIQTNREAHKDKLEEVTKWLNEAGIVFYSGVMIGFPGQGKEDLKEAVEYARFIKDLGAIAVTFHWLHPYPGTRLYERFYHLVPQERRWQTNPEFWNFIKPVIPLKDISLDDAEGYINEKYFEINGTKSRNPSCLFQK